MHSLGLVAQGVDFHPGVYQPSEPSTLSLMLFGMSIILPGTAAAATKTTIAADAAAIGGQLTLGEGDAVLAVVQEGKIIAQAPISSGLSHVEFVARTLGTLPEGAEVVTIGKFDGQIVAIASRSIAGNQLPASAAAQAAAQAVFK
jgi:hypothetical protein